MPEITDDCLNILPKSNKEFSRVLDEFLKESENLIDYILLKKFP